MVAERSAGLTVGPAEHPHSLGDPLVGPRTAARHREQQQQSGLSLGIAASERQAGGDVLPQTDRVAAQATAGCGGPEPAAVDADQTELARRLTEFGDRDGEVFAVSLADPVGLPAEMLHGVEDECRREVTGAGELHPVAEPFEEPPVGLDDVGPGGGLSRAVELRPVDHRQKLRAARGAQPGDELSDVGPHPPSVTCVDSRGSAQNA